MTGAYRLGDDDALVADTADVDQVDAAEFVEQERARHARDDVRTVMSTRQGRRAVRRWLGLHGLYKSVTAIESTALTYALSGRRDAGLEMLQELTLADEQQYLAMEHEAREDEAALLREAVARRVQ